MPGVPPDPPTPPGPQTLRASTEEWIVAVTMATEAPPTPTKSPHSAVEFTATQIPVAIRAVAEVIANRAASGKFPDSPLGVVLQVKQFSGVLRGLALGSTGHRDFWLDAVLGKWYPEHVARCLYEWRRLARTPTPAVAPGALYYYSPVGMLPPHRVPTWAVALTVVPVTGLPEDYFRFFR